MLTLMIRKLEFIENFRSLNLEIFVSSNNIRCNMFVITNEFLRN